MNIFLKAINLLFVSPGVITYLFHLTLLTAIGILILRNECLIAIRTQLQ